MAIALSGSLSLSGSITATGNITAQTLVVQTITSSVEYSSGSNVFGNVVGNTQQFTGSVLVSGSMNVNANSLVVNTNGTVSIGNTNSTYNLDVTGTGRFTGALSGTSATFSGTGYSVFQGSAYLQTAASTGLSFGYNRSGGNGESTIVWGAPASGFNFEIASVTSGTITPRLTITTTGAATFSSSVTAANAILSSSASNIFVINSTDANGGYQRFQRSGTDIGFIGSAYHIISGGANTDIALSSTGAVVFGTGGSLLERMRITSGGNLSIGNSSPQTLYWANVRGSIIGNYSSISSNSSSGWTSLANNAAQTANASEASGWTYQNTDQAAKFSLTNGGFRFQVSGTGTAGNAISWTDAMTIMDAVNGGKIGIGTTSPNSALEVNGVVRATQFGGSGYPYNGIFTGLADASYAQLSAGSTSGYYTGITTFGGGYSTPNLITFTTASTERMRITSGGTVKAGTSTSSLSSNVIFSAGSSGALGIQTIQSSGSGTVDTGIPINQGSGGQTVLLLASRHTSSGTSTNSAVYMIKFYYDGNNAPATTLIAGEGFMSFGVSGTNTLTLTAGGSAVFQYTFIGNK